MEEQEWFHERSSHLVKEDAVLDDRNDVVPCARGIAAGIDAIHCSRAIYLALTILPLCIGVAWPVKKISPNDSRDARSLRSLEGARLAEICRHGNLSTDVATNILHRYTFVGD